jgi:YVTN family beta-propeller protein
MWVPERSRLLDSLAGIPIMCASTSRQPPGTTPFTRSAADRMICSHSMTGSLLAPRFAALALASLTLLATGATGRAQPAYPEEAAVVTTLALEPDGSRPSGLAVNSQTNRIYVANAGSDNVSVVDGAGNSVIAAITVGRAPHAVAVDPRANRVYVANSGSDDVTVIDGETHEVVTTVSVGQEPWDLAADPSTGRVFVSNHRSGTISVIGGRHDSVIRTVSVGHLPTAVAVNPDTNRVYVLSSAGSDLAVVDGVSKLLIATVPLASSSVQASDLAVDSSSNLVYVATSIAETTDATVGAIALVDASNNSLVDSIALAAPIETLAVDSARGRIYAGSPSEDHMWVIDAGSKVVTSAVSLQGDLSAVAVDSAGGRVYVANGEGASLSIVSWMPGLTLAPGWTYACYVGNEGPLDDALTGARDGVSAVYRLRPDGSYDRWFSGRPDLSTIATVRPYEALFILADDYTPWLQEPSEADSALSPGPGWNSLCYSAETKEADVAVREMSDEIAVAYDLAPDGTWRRFVVERPEITNMTHVRSYSPLIVLVPVPEAPGAATPVQEASEEFLALRTALEDRIRSYYGDVAICVTDLQTSEQICVNADAPHRTGCTINMFALFAAVEEFEAGRANPQDWAYWIRIGIGHSSPPEVAVFLRGIKGSLEEGVRRASELMQSWGMRDSVFDHVPGYPGQNWQHNILTARETNMVLAKLYREELFSAEWTDYAIGRLLDIKPGLNYVLPGLLPAGVWVAHKIGYYADWDGWVYNDAGIVMMEQGDKQIAYAISYLSQAMPSEYAGYSFGAQLSKIAYDWFEERY